MMRLLIVLLTTLIAPPVLAQNAADAYYDLTEMAKARVALQSSHGSQTNALILAEHLEIHSNDGDPLAVWEAQGWVGGDIQKLWFKTNGEYEPDEGRFEEAEVQGLYSRAVNPFWHLQVGLRHDIKPDPSRTYAVVGVQGVATYWFELDGQVFLSDQGDIFARLEAGYEFRITQRLMLQPQIELNGAFSDDEDISVGRGLSTVEAGLRLRYEFNREFAPYIGVSWRSAFGKTEDFIGVEGEDSDQVSWVAGIRFWF